MALNEYLENYKPPKSSVVISMVQRSVKFMGTSLQALEEGYKDTTALVNWLG